MSKLSNYDIDLQNKAEEVKEATGVNQHTVAYFLICKFLGFDELVSILEEIWASQKREGCLLAEDYNKRNLVYKEMNKLGRAKLGVEVYDKYFYQNT